MRHRDSIARATVVLVITVSVIGLPSAGADPVSMTDVPIQMSDGVALYANVDLPDASGTFPTVLNMTPYGPATYFSMYLGNGYAHVNVDIRGSGRSGGVLCVFCDREQQDVYEVVEWVASQDWSDTNVGMMGGSYQGITPLLGATKQPPHLKAIVPAVAYADPYRDIAWHNGLFTYNFIAQWTVLQAALSMTGASANPALADRVDNFVAIRARESEWDGPSWRERAVWTKWDQIEVPTLLLGGWFDGFARGTIWNFQNIASEHKRLVMNPGVHKGVGGPFDPLSPYTGAGNPPGEPADLTLAWFDRFLKGIENNVEDGPAMLYYDLGSYEWRSTDVWPPGDAEIQRFYLSGEPSSSATSWNDGSLAGSVPTGSASAPDAYFYDPSGVADTLGKWGTVAGTPHARFDQRADELHALTYTTGALAEPLTLTGPIELHMWAQTDADDTDFVARVSDVAPDGSSMLITTGFMRASHREWDHLRSKPAEPWISNLQPTPIYKLWPMEFRVDIWHTAYQLQPGHRLRLTISSSDVANHEPMLQPARNTIFHDARLPAELLVTVA